MRRFIVWYLQRCGGGFHIGPYGEHGLYVSVMSDREYSRRSAIISASIRANRGQSDCDHEDEMRSIRDAQLDAQEEGEL